MSLSGTSYRPALALTGPHAEVAAVAAQVQTIFGSEIIQAISECGEPGLQCLRRL